MVIQQKHYHILLSQFIITLQKNLTGKTKQYKLINKIKYYIRETNDCS